MTDPVAFYAQAVAKTNTFINAYEDLKLIADRLAADSYLSGQAATAAQSHGRADLLQQDFDNLRMAVDLVNALMATTVSQTVSNNVNTGGECILAFYKMI